MVAISKTLRGLVGNDQVTTWAELTSGWQQKLTTVFFKDQPACSKADDGSDIKGFQPPVVYPQTLESLAEVMRACHQNHWQVLLCGQGTKLDWGRFGSAHVVVSLAKLNRVVNHWEKDFTICVEAGVQFSELRSQLQKTGQFLALDPLYAERATLGGIVATGDTGSLRQRYGGVRDMLIGVKFVRHDGQIVKAGGRVVKNVAGYDLMKLMTGAYGTLGILSELTLRLFPLPEQSKTVVFRGQSDVIDKISRQVLSVGLTPIAMDILVDPGKSPLLLAGRFQGIAAGVEEQVSRFLALGKSLGLAGTILEKETAFWNQLPERLVSQDEVAILCKIGIMPKEIVNFWEQANQILPEGWIGRIHTASGLGLIRFDDCDQAKVMIEQLRSQCRISQGYLTVLKAPPSLKQQIDIWGYTGNAAGMMAQLKNQFDPLNLINAKRFINGI